MSPTAAGRLRLNHANFDNVVLWDWPIRRQARVLSCHISTVTSFAFSPDSLTLATAGEDRSIKLWERASGQLLHTMTGNTGPLRAVAFVGRPHRFHRRLRQPPRMA